VLTVKGSGCVALGHPVTSASRLAPGGRWPEQGGRRVWNRSGAVAATATGHRD